MSPAGPMAPEDVHEVLDRQSQVLELIAVTTPLHDVLATILQGLEQLMPRARCSVLLLDREQGTLHHGAAPSLPADYVAVIDGMPIGDSAGSCGTAAWNNAPVVTEDVRRDPRWDRYREAALAAGLTSCWSTPIEGRDGLPVGTFAVYHAVGHRPSPREQLLVDRFTHLASVAIEHARLLGELVQSEERFRRSFDDNALGMAILGLDRRIVTCNDALAALLGSPAGALAGRDLGEVLEARGRELGGWLDELGRRGHEPVSFEGHLRRGDRDAVEVEITVSLLNDAGGAPVQYVVNVFDLTERRAAERERRARVEAETARRTAEEHSHAKSELLAAVGHEARTPIQAIVGFAELLGTMDLDADRQHEALAHITTAAGHVMGLLDDVLDLSRIEADVLSLDLEPICLPDIVEEVFALLSSAAAGRRASLGHELASEWVRADRRRLRQVLLNLVGNSIRHGKAGTRVHLRPHPASDSATVRVSVDDDGPGIPADLLPRLFTPFSRSSAPHAVVEGHGFLEQEGLGLGLGLAHGLAGAMGGRLSLAVSAPDGTSMLLELPRAADPGR